MVPIEVPIQKDFSNYNSGNNILQKAIKIYLQEKCSLEIDDAEVFLLPQKEIKLEKDQYGDVCLFSGRDYVALQ